jgi:hypothetical protein
VCPEGLALDICDCVCSRLGGDCLVFGSVLSSIRFRRQCVHMKLSGTLIPSSVSWRLALDICDCVCSTLGGDCLVLGSVLSSIRFRRQCVHMKLHLVRLETQSRKTAALCTNISGTPDASWYEQVGIIWFKLFGKLLLPLLAWRLEVKQFLCWSQLAWNVAIILRVAVFIGAKEYSMITGCTTALAKGWLCKSVVPSPHEKNHVILLNKHLVSLIVC